MIYLDTSAAIPLFVPEPASDAVDAWFESCDETLISSDWILTDRRDDTLGRAGGALAKAGILSIIDPAAGADTLHKSRITTATVPLPKPT